MMRRTLCLFGFAAGCVPTSDVLIGDDTDSDTSVDTDVQSDDTDTTDDTDPDDNPHPFESVSIEVVVSSVDGLDVPRDLAFDPENPSRLWIVNMADDSVTIVHDALDETRTTEHLIDPYAFHFMEEVSSIAFGAPDTFATCQESRNTYNDQGAPNDFMGPTLWSADLDVFATSNDEAVDALSDMHGFHVDLGSHLDMLHESPLCTGITWESNNIYWVFDGLNESLTMNDFQTDHGVGWDDHHDGRILRYAEGEISYVEDVSSHLVFDAATSLLYVADSGNGRIAVLDTTSGTQGVDLPSAEGHPLHARMNDADISTLIGGLTLPSGLEIYQDHIYVSDHQTGVISVYTLDGVPILEVETNRPGIMGMAFDSQGSLWVVDSAEDEVVRIRPN